MAQRIDSQCRRNLRRRVSNGSPIICAVRGLEDATTRATTETHTDIKRIRCNRIDCQTMNLLAKYSVAALGPTTPAVGGLVDAGVAGEITNRNVQRQRR